MSASTSSLRTAGALAALLLSGCAATPLRDVPVDVPDPANVRVTVTPGFRIFVDGGCLSAEETEGLVAELSDARRRLEALIGPYQAPGSFRGYDVPRATCPSSRATSPTIDVVVVRGGDRCHADVDGITVTRRHVPRRDATHELVHFLAGSSWRPIDEGLAVYLTERLWGPDQGVPVKVRARAFLDLSLDVDLTHDSVRRGMSRRDYDTAGAFVGWLLEAYGPEPFWELYCGAVRNYHTAYGLGERDLWRRFWGYVRNLDVRQNAAYYAYRDKLTGG